MLTLFSTAKPFRGHNDIIQRNALRSWKLLHPDVEVILFGDEPGAAEVCAELGLRHEPHVERTISDPALPLATYLFNRAQKIARHDFLCYANCDIILMSDFWKALNVVAKWREKFLMVGHRWNTDIREAWKFERPNWELQLRRKVAASGTRSTQYEVDYFAFPKRLFLDLPALVIGRVYWDNWMVWKARSLRVPVVDCSAAMIAVHQDHDFAYRREIKVGFLGEKEARWNYELAGNGRHLCTIEDATHRLTRSGRVRRTPFRRQLAGPKHALWKIFVQKTFPLRERLGIRRKNLEKILHRDSESGA